MMKVTFDDVESLYNRSSIASMNFSIPIPEALIFDETQLEQLIEEAKDLEIGGVRDVSPRALHL